MKAGWLIKNIEDCIDRVQYTNKVQRKAFQESGDYPIVSQEQDFINGYWSDKADVFKVTKPVVIFGDHTKAIKYVDFDFVLGADGVKILQAKDFIFPRYFYYYLQAFPIKSLGYARHYRLLKELDISFPQELSEQKRIVAILDEAFAGIDQAIANTEKSLASAHELFDSTLNTIFTQKGEGWEERTISDLVKQGILDKPLDGNHGETHPKKSDFVDEGVPFVMASDLVDGEVDQLNCNFLSLEQADRLRKGFAKNGDILLSHKGTIGRVAILNTEHDYVMLTPQVTYYRIKEADALYNQYLYFFFQSPHFKKEMGAIAGIGTTRAYIGITRQMDLSIAYPDIDQQKDIAKKLFLLVKATESFKAIYERKLTSLNELKQSLLQKAFSGELTANADKLSEAAE